MIVCVHAGACCADAHQLHGSGHGEVQPVLPGPAACGQQSRQLGSAGGQVFVCFAR